MDEGIN